MRISDIGKLAKAEADDNFELRVWLIKQQHSKDTERRWKIERDLRNGVGEDYDVPEQLNAILLKRIFNLMNGLWNTESYGTFTSEIAIGRPSKENPRPMLDNLRGIRSSQTFKIPGVGKPVVMDRWDGYRVYGIGERDEFTTSLGLRGQLGSFALVGEGKSFYMMPEITESPTETQLSGLGRTATYQRDIETLVNIYSTLDLDKSIMHEEPVIQPV